MSESLEDMDLDLDDLLSLLSESYAVLINSVSEDALQRAYTPRVDIPSEPDSEPDSEPEKAWDALRARSLELAKAHTLQLKMLSELRSLRETVEHVAA